MKACIVLQNQYSKVSHAIALYLKEQYKIDEFSAYVISKGAYEYVQNQKDIRYSPILADHELHASYTSEVLDLEYIKDFENRFQPPELWRYFYCDRKLMMSIGPKEETTTSIDPLYNHEDLMRIFQVRSKAIEKMLIENRPDFVLFFNSIGSLGHLTLYYTAKKLGIPTFNIDLARVGSLNAISEDYRMMTGVYNYFKQDTEVVFDNNEEQKARELLTKFRETASLDLEYLQVGQNLSPEFRKSLLPPNIFSSLKYLITLSKNFWDNRSTFTYGETAMNPIRFVWYKLRQRFRRLRGLKSLYSQPADEDYAFYPLHYEPEMATLLLSPFYFDQIEVLRHISRSLPLHFKLYVKEHPYMGTSRRARSFYTEILKLPNVKLIPHGVSSLELIKKAKLITVITGTAGWEACFIGKPVITFGDIFYNALSFVRHVTDMEKLPYIIREQLTAFKYNEPELIRFLASILKDTVPVNITALWHYTDAHVIKNDSGLRALIDNLMKKVNAII